MALLLLASWLAGLVWFIRTIPTEVADPNRVTDAIVVLTGGSLRVQSGLGLLADGKAKKLFISGVYHSVDVAALLHVAGRSPDNVACCIALGHEADSTLGNARETAAWMREQGFHSLRLVTASYHMRRSLLEFSRVMPDMEIVAHPVFPDLAPRGPWWWAEAGSLRLLVSEYTKYLAALVRPVLTGGSD